jgi:hypothetical protein
VVGGGFQAGAIDNITLFAARTSGTTYSVIADNEFSGPNTIQAQAICASGPGVTATATADVPKAFATALAQAREQASRK